MKSEETYEIEINLDISDDFTINTATDSKGTITVNVQGRESHPPQASEGKFRLGFRAPCLFGMYHCFHSMHHSNLHLRLSRPRCRDTGKLHRYR